MTEQCNIYLDPWDKADLEGTAMLIGRMPDIADRTYRGITCQRWFVRFLPDQDIIFRWLDYDDAKAYVYPIADSGIFTQSLATLTRDENSPAADFLKIGEVLATYRTPDLHAAHVMPQQGGLSRATVIYTVDAATGGSSLSTLRLYRNGASLAGYTLTHSTTVGGPYALNAYHPTPLPLALKDRLSFSITGSQPAGESVTLIRLVTAMQIAWGDFT